MDSLDEWKIQSKVGDAEFAGRPAGGAVTAAVAGTVVSFLLQDTTTVVGSTRPA